MPSVELIVNGGAESGLAGWDVAPVATDRIDTVSTPVFSGSSAFRFRHDLGLPSAEISITQYIATVPGTTYEGSVAYRSAGSPGGGNSHSAALLLDLQALGFNTTLQVVQWHEVSGDYKAIPFTFTALGATTGFRLVTTSITPFPTINTVYFYIDGVSVPSIDEPPLLGLGDVTFGQILDSIQFDAGDFSTPYRNNARNWLNLVRSAIASMQWWSTALRGDAQMAVSGTVESGIYPLKDQATPTPNKYAFVDGDSLYDITHGHVLQYKTRNEIYYDDPDVDHTSQPFYWTDSGFNDQGEPLIQLYPRPTTALTIQFPGYKQFTAVDENSDDFTIDPFFGPIDDWAYAFTEGMRYFLEQDENETGMMAQDSRFMRAVRQRISRNGISIVMTTRMRHLGVSPSWAVDRQSRPNFYEPVV